MQTHDFYYDLPKELIAQTPIERRDASRLMTLDRRTGAVGHHHFYDLPDFLNPGDCLILNDSRVLPARLLGQRLPGGGACEVLLLTDKGDKVWEGDDANEFYEKQQLFTSYAEATPRSMGQSGYGSVNQPLILSLDGETEPIVPVSMTVMIVNPRSTRIDQAAAYLTAYAGHYEAETENIMFFPDQNDPVPNSYYEVQKQSYEESLQDLDSRIEKADESEKASLRDNREQIQGFLDELENQRMSVTEEMIQAYREQVAPYLYVTPQTPLTNSDSSGELGTLTSQYLDHAIDLDTYIREMDQRVRMMMLEDM